MIYDQYLLILERFADTVLKRFGYSLYFFRENIRDEYITRYVRTENKYKCINIDKLRTGNKYKRISPDKLRASVRI